MYYGVHHHGLAQNVQMFIDSIQKAHEIPELGVAVISSDSVLYMRVSGVQRAYTDYEAHINDQFRIGSNTKEITSWIAFDLVKKKRLKWNTRFFDLFPELKEGTDKLFYTLTLWNLLTCRTRLYPYSYDYPEPAPEQFIGPPAEIRYAFMKWCFSQPPVNKKGSFHWSNLAYVAVGLMLEKASGKTYEQLVYEWADGLEVHVGFGAPNVGDSLQPWGHTEGLIPEAPALNEKLNWLMAAGNVHMSLPDYSIFIQENLRGLRGQSTHMSQSQYEKMHYGALLFGAGWFWLKDEQGRKFSYHTGNPGSFMSRVIIYPKQDRAFILLTNAQTQSTLQGLDWLELGLKKIFGLGQNK